MPRILANWLGKLPAIVAGLLMLEAPCHGESFAYIGFSAPSSVIFQGDTALTNERVRLTPSERGKAGGVWSSAKQPVGDGFETSFQFQFTQPGGRGANGIAFVIQNNATPHLGVRGHGMGFRGIPNSLVVKFDPYHYKDHHYVKYDEVAALVNNSSAVYPPDAGAIGSTTNAMFSDGQIHTAKIIYVAGHLEVFLDDLQNPLLTVPLNLAEAVTLDSGCAWVGFTAATGADSYNQDVISWAFHSTVAAVQKHAFATPSASVQLQNITDSQISAPTYFANGVHTVPTTPLPVDPAFGYALPGDVSLTHQIEASTDLIHWTPVTNVVLYFRDPESTNYDHRFYRFRER